MSREYIDNPPVDVAWSLRGILEELEAINGSLQRLVEILATEDTKPEDEPLP